MKIKSFHLQNDIMLIQNNETTDEKNLAETLDNHYFWKSSESHLVDVVMVSNVINNDTIIHIKEAYKNHAVLQSHMRRKNTTKACETNGR